MPSTFSTLPESSLHYTPHHATPLYHHPIPADNSCLFTCLSYYTPYLTKHGHQIRRQICEYLASHREEYEFYIADTSFSNYLKKLRKNAWGSDLEIRAFLDMTLRDEHIGELRPNIKEIRVYDEMRGSVISFEGDVKHQRVIHLLYRNGNHYDLLWDEDEYERRTACQSVVYELIDEALDSVQEVTTSVESVEKVTSHSTDQFNWTKTTPVPNTTTVPQQKSHPLDYRNLHYDRWLNRADNKGGPKKKAAFPTLGGKKTSPVVPAPTPATTTDAQDGTTSESEAPPVVNPWGQAVDWQKVLTQEEKDEQLAKEEEANKVEASNVEERETHPTQKPAKPSTQQPAKPTTQNPAKPKGAAFTTTRSKSKPLSKSEAKAKTQDTTPAPTQQQQLPPAPNAWGHPASPVTQTQETKTEEQPSSNTQAPQQTGSTSAPPQQNNFLTTNPPPQFNAQTTPFIPTGFPPQGYYPPYMMPPPHFVPPYGMPQHFVPPHGNGSAPQQPFVPSTTGAPYSPQPQAFYPAPYMMPPPQASGSSPQFPPSYPYPPPQHMMPPQGMYNGSTDQPNQVPQKAHDAHHGQQNRSGERRQYSSRGRGRGGLYHHGNSSSRQNGHEESGDGNFTRRSYHSKRGATREA